MKKKIIIACSVVVGLIILIGSAYYFISRSNSLTLAVIFRNNPYKKGYKCTGSGNVSMELDTEKLKAAPGFPEGEAGQLYINVLKSNISSLSMKIDYEGQGNGKEASYKIKVSSESLPEYEDSFYTDGIKKWVKNSVSGTEAKWTEVAPSGSIDNIIPFIDVVRFENAKDYIKLKAQDEDSSTFGFKLTGPMVESIFGTEGGNAIKKLSDGQSMDDFIKEINLIAEMKTERRVNIFTPYARMKNVKMSFTMPYEKFCGLMGDGDMSKLSEDEKKIYKAVNVKAVINVDFNYGEVNIEKPQM
jgi:hypothetical protein